MKNQNFHSSNLSIGTGWLLFSDRVVLSGGGVSLIPKEFPRSDAPAESSKKARQKYEQGDKKKKDAESQERHSKLGNRLFAENGPESTQCEGPQARKREQRQVATPKFPPRETN